MGNVIRFPAKYADSWITAVRDGEEVCIRLNLPVAYGTGDDLLTSPADARVVGQEFMRAAYEAEQAIKARQETKDGLVNVSFRGTSRDGSTRGVAYVRAQVIQRGPFITRLRAITTENGLSQKYDGVEFDVHTATGESVDRKPHRRWWQVEKEHVSRLAVRT